MVWAGEERVKGDREIMFSTVSRVARLGGAHRAAIRGIFLLFLLLFLLVSSWLVVSVLLGTDSAARKLLVRTTLP
jgi:hypothetical protein